VGGTGLRPAHPHIDPVLLAEYARPWPVALAGAVVAAGLTLVLVPLRRGECWALGTSLVVWVALLVTRITTAPRRLVLDAHQHGCHTFIIAVLLGVIGLVQALATLSC